jgi:presenilin-like A22 family membrane protease
MQHEHIVRASFSGLAATVLFYMAAEYIDLFIRRRYWWALGIAGVCNALGLSEIWKVGARVERLLGLR